VKRVLITGGNGQLGTDLGDQLGVEPLSHAELDIADDAAVARAVEGVDVVFNCAAFHNVDLCETEEEMAFRINHVAVKRMAQACAAAGAKLVHFSTNYVFDGRRAEPYDEDDLPAPRSVYAQSKLAGEYAAVAYTDKALVIRSAGLYGLHGSGQKGGNFVTRVLGRANAGEPIRMVSDQRLQPTFTRDLAAAVIGAVEADADGVLHLTASGECSWLEFTEAIFEIAGLDVEIEAITTPTGGTDRPRNGVLARPRADSLGLKPLRDWREALGEYMRDAAYAA
jgi:dTDP-4-dehydrorhamnose reductase